MNMVHENYNLTLIEAYNLSQVTIQDKLMKFFWPTRRFDGVKDVPSFLKKQSQNQLSETRS